MSEFKGTKGEWQVVQKGEPNPDNSNCGYHTVNSSDDENDTIADIWFSDIHVTKTKEEALYNAKLIACAPEMLEMLNKILIHVDFSYENWTSSHGLIIKEEIELLLKKATT